VPGDAAPPAQLSIAEPIEQPAAVGISWLDTRTRREYRAGEPDPTHIARRA